jgi:NADPH:quinone reductase-like Zn-dependent oxidoreductase
MANAQDRKVMRAWLYTSTSGGLENTMRLTDAAPQPQVSQSSDMLVQVQRMSPNPTDYKVAEHGVVARAVIPVPASPGADYAGTVVETGSGITAFHVGDRVFGRLDKVRHGSMARYVVVRSGECALVPDGVSLDDASTVGTAGLTAYQLLSPNVKQGDKVFLNGGSGGTGTFEIQIAKVLGCHVTTSCSGRNVELCRSLGADEVIDYTTENVSEVLKAKGQIFDLVIDNIGNSPADLYKAADVYLKPDGKYLQIAWKSSLSGMMGLVGRSVIPSMLGGGKRKWEHLLVLTKYDDLVQMGQWMHEGRVKAVIDDTFEFEDAPEAIKKLKTGRTRGNIVVKVSK